MLLTAELVVVDLTDLNANVMYEMGIRQAWNLPLIPIISHDQFDRLPFDIKVLNTVPYYTKIKIDNISIVKKQETIRSIRKQLKSINTGNQKDTVFSKAFSTITKQTTSDIACIALLEALSDIDASLYDLKHDFDKTLNHNPVLLESSSRLLSYIFTRLDDKRHALGTFARGKPGEPVDGNFQKFLKETKKIIESGIKIDKFIRRGCSDKIKKDDIESSINSIIKQIRNLSAEIKTNKKLIT